jgi:hypothetical protein
MILAEELVLLSLDPDRGAVARGIDVDRLRRAAAAAILGELILHRRINSGPDGLMLSDPLPDFHPLLAEASRIIGRHTRPLAREDAIGRIANGIGGLIKRLLRSLVARDILHDQREAFFLHRYPVRSMQALREVFGHVHAVIAGQGTTQQVALAGFSDAGGVLAVRMTPEERLRARRQIDSRRESANADLAALLDLAHATGPGAA